MEPIALDSVAQEHPDSEGLAGCGDPNGFLLSNYSSKPLVATPSEAFDRSYELSNRCLDCVLASLLIVLILPLMAVCAIAVLLSGGGPLVFRQPRIGRGGQEFNCLKWRTMVPGGESLFLELLQNDEKAREEWLALQKVQNDPRVTPIGRFLRRYCIDELPQLVNVLAGDMSIVGPRPIVAAEISRYGPQFRDYCSVKPGLTGLWQVSGRHKLSYEQRVQLDSQYARNKCASTDLVILWRTVRVVLLGLNQ